MRKEVKVIDRPSLTVHVDYDHVTVGELGNILIRLQAALRSMAGLSPGEYDGRYYREQPRFVTSTVHTKQSIDITLLLAILAVVMSAPGAFYQWSRFATDVFRWFKTTILAIVIISTATTSNHSLSSVFPYFTNIFANELLSTKKYGKLLQGIKRS